GRQAHSACRDVGGGLVGGESGACLCLDQPRRGAARPCDRPAADTVGERMNAYLTIDRLQLAFAALLLLVNLVLSTWLRLGLARSLLVASLRMVVQLLLVGVILGYIFALKRPLPVLAIGFVMVVLAGIAAVGRTKRRFPGIYL